MQMKGNLKKANEQKRHIKLKETQHKENPAMLRTLVYIKQKGADIEEWYVDGKECLLRGIKKNA